MSSREYALKRKYNLTLKDYDNLLTLQNGLCALCGLPPKKGTNLHVDHDHKTMEVRGLLHGYCNRYIIGRHRDPDVFERAARYLRGPFSGIFANKIKRKRTKRKKKR